MKEKFKAVLAFYMCVLIDCIYYYNTSNDNYIEAGKP